MYHYRSMIILAEKPSVATDIAKALGRFKLQNGIWISGKDCVLSARGHLLISLMPEEYDSKWKSWKDSLKDLPINPQKFLYKENPVTKDVLHQIKKCFKEFDSSEFILATDAEREGEVIGAEILDYVGFKNYENAKRFWVSEALTPDVVRKGLAEAKPLSYYEAYKAAGFARANADWLIGMNFSRLLTVSTGNRAIFSFGRVQTAILGVIYLRDKNIKNFIPQDYYQLVCKVRKGNFDFSLYYNKDDSDRFANKTELEFLTDKLTDQDKLKITKIETTEKTENAPQLFNITGLQKYCSNKYHFTPQQTLDTAQVLYEKYKCLSYPRTPSVVLGDENVELFKSKFDLLSKEYPELAKNCDTSKISSDNKRLFNTAKLTDHHALIPLKPIPKEAGENEKNVYNAVLLRFFQTIMPACVYNSITVNAEKDNMTFIGKGRSYINKGWKNTSESDNEDEKEIETFPTDLQENELLPIIETSILSKQTQPKKHFTNATILALMENPKSEDVEKVAKLVGLGTPATRAGIIKELIDRQYIEQKGQQLLITKQGEFLIETVIKIPCLKDFISLSTTTRWEEQLQTEPEKFLQSIKNFITTEIPKITITDTWKTNEIGQCPICRKAEVLEGKNSYYCSDYKNGCKFSIAKNICGANISVNDVKLLISGKQTGTKKMTSAKTQKQFSAKLAYEKGKIEFKF